jgi:hypothetical protein
MLVSVSGYKLRFEQRVVPKRGKRPEKAVNVMVQETDAWFCLFGGSDGDGHKASAQHYNIIREDKISFYTKGNTVHGEWFLDGERLPRRPSGPAGPAPSSTRLHDLPAVGSKLRTEGEADAGEAWTLKDAPPRDPLLPTKEGAPPRRH